MKDKEDQAPGVVGEDVTVVIPTLNAASTLERCLLSIRSQRYRGEVDIIVADGGSSDSTREIARSFDCVVVENPGRTGESGKACGIRHATGDLVALVDSDNILVGNDWLQRMAEPFRDPAVSGSEPLRFEYRPFDPPLTRYCALLGMNDPLCHFLGNYDRENVLTRTWTGLEVETRDRGGYIQVRLSTGAIPTMGANGFVVRRTVLEEMAVGDYLFDIDLVHRMVESGHDTFAKVRVGIVHLYGRGLRDLARKQLRRVRDYVYHSSRGERSYPWSTQEKRGLLRFIVYCLLLVPLLVEALRGYLRVRDGAWLLHPPACVLTLLVYSWGFLEGFIRPGQQSRDRWSQRG